MAMELQKELQEKVEELTAQVAREKMENRHLVQQIQQMKENQQHLVFVIHFSHTSKTLNFLKVDSS